MESNCNDALDYYPGKLIALEGVDGAGTTTQAFFLHQKLIAEGYKAHLTKEPSSGAVGQLIRKIIGGGGNTFPLFSQKDKVYFKIFMSLLFTADRVEHLNAEIIWRLKQGEHVITDRYALSTLVYQVDEAVVTREWISQLIPLPVHPDITVILQLDAEKAEERLVLRGEKREVYESSIEKIRRHSELYEEFSELAYDKEDEFLFLRHQNIVALEADGSETEVAASVWNAVKEIIER